MTNESKEQIEPLAKSETGGASADKVLAHESSAAIRRARLRKLYRRLALFVFLPTLLASVYYLFLVAPEYESRTQIRVRAADASLVKERAALVKKLLRAPDTLIAVDAETQLWDHYQTSGDVVRGLASDASQSEALAYTLERLEVDHDDGSRSFDLALRAFDPQMAQMAQMALLHQLQERLSTLSPEPAGGEAQASTEVARAKTALAAAYASAEALRPSEEASAEDRAQYQVALFEASLKEGDYEAAIDKAQRAKSAPLSLQVISKPTLDQAAVYPRVLWNIATVFFVCLALAGVLTMLGSSVKEHARF